MHPATRRLLQGEVKRTFGAAPAPAGQSWRAWRWPLVALWGGMVALLVMFATINSQFHNLEPAHSKEEGRRMKDEKSDALTRRSLPSAAPVDQRFSGPRPGGIAPATVAESAPPPAPAAVPPAETAVAAMQPPVANATSAAALDAAAAPAAAIPLLEPKLTSPVPAVPMPEPKLSRQPLPMPQPNVSLAPRSAPPATFKFADRAPSGVASASAPPMAGFARSRSVAAAPSPASDALEVTADNFVQVRNRGREGAGPLPPSNLLSNFRMRRSGQNVSVFDADGSVYNGQVLDVESHGGAFGGEARQDAKTLQDVNQAANWTFNVTGINHSLRQNVSFTGNVLTTPATNAPAQAGAQARRAAQFQNASKAAQAASAQNSRINGKVQVGGGKSYEIEAAPPAP
jgi:hypothetical protein